eukprot:12291_1
MCTTLQTICALFVFIYHAHCLSFNDTNNECWYLIQNAKVNVLTPLNVCYGSGTGAERTVTQMAKIIDDKSIHMQFYVNGNCSGPYNWAEWYNKSAGYSMYADLQRGRDCGLVTQLYKCEDNSCDKCNDKGSFVESVSVTGKCMNGVGGENVVQSCALNKYSTDDIYDDSDVKCEGNPAVSSNLYDGCRQLSGADAYWYKTVYCENYK